MERTKKVKFKIRHDPDRDNPIERRVIIGLITNTDFITKIRDRWDVKLLETSYAKKLAEWCVAYYDKYQQAIGTDIVHRFAEICSQKKVTKDEAESIGDILDSLSKQHIKEGVDQFLVDQTITYFRRRQAEVLIEQMQAALENQDLDTFHTLQSEFKPMPSSLSDNKRLTVKEIYDMEIKPVAWLIENLLPKGLTILAGKSKAGKSFLTLNMVLNLVQDNWMFTDASDTGFKGDSGAVLYLSLEDGLRRVKERMRVIDPDPDPKASKYLDIYFEWDKLNSGGLTAIEEWIKKSKQERRRPKLVVIDVLAKVWNKGTNTSGGNLYAEEYKIYGALADVAHKHNISIIAITHTVKGKTPDPFDQILGGSGMQGPADNLMVLESGRGDTQKILHIKGKDIEEMHLAFEATNNHATWICLGELTEVQKTSQRQSIYNYIKENGPSTYGELREAIKNGGILASLNSINTILLKMVREGQLEQLGKNQPYAIKGTMSNQIGEGLNKKNYTPN